MTAWEFVFSRTDHVAQAKRTARIGIEALVVNILSCILPPSVIMSCWAVEERIVH
ncbi:hypothetical protein BAUCODRAFT_39814 [Baudoinia panamericana UAMH 10762]|uniref:Uncharacterized protein n=1 Tax=Baudoinia panamericana (strain UAMH 10762) TaxID=717646 RepID=M2LB46_BAUPA|nr:uncharacterized protein BAUCODRAFT_39814 [Baudoinia panamericana UAMH 10762]EMC91037.1 hypothetical protein BAUCODRAFT_39814 [Baudoinia panamericana UAMH 10762]